MCGIAGIVARERRIDLEALIRKMTWLVRHRGPDDEGCCVRGRVALGHRRLSIIDLSAKGHQPMEFADGRYVITFGGEIYNYLELREELKGLGFGFRSDTDTEVILAAYAAWGTGCLSRFNGMWAFAIHDRDEDVVFAARDRFGVKPFYYVLTDKYFAFGSEIRQLLPLLPSTVVDSQVAANFLLTGVQVQSENTFFRDVHALPPGHFVLYRLRDDQCTIERYYNLEQRLTAFNDLPESRKVAQFRTLLEDAVRLRLRSDVRVGTCLSGGLDSSSVALIAARMHREASNTPFAAVTAISEDPGNSEEVQASTVVRAGELAWITTRPTYADFRELLPTVVIHQEEPFTTPSICLQAFVMRAAAENRITVLLDGQGADEVLLGYMRYHAARCIELWRERGTLGVCRGLADTLRHNDEMTFARYAGYLVSGLSPAWRHFYYRRRTPVMAQRLPRPAWIDHFTSAYLDVRRLQTLEMETTHLPYLLRYEDKNSMAFGIEARLPFLDYRLVEYAIALSTDLKIRDGWTKWILRRAMSGILPQEIAWRTDKLGFEAPDELWLTRHGPEMFAKVKSSPLLRHFCKVDRLLADYHRLPPQVQFRLYSVALWEEAFNVAAA
jgi:asparagine synthase (glutamine-hydrolysing)